MNAAISLEDPFATDGVDGVYCSETLFEIEQVADPSSLPMYYIFYMYFIQFHVDFGELICFSKMSFLLLGTTKRRRGLDLPSACLSPIP